MSPIMTYITAFDSAYEATQQLKPEYRTGALDRLEAIQDELTKTNNLLRAAEQLNSLTKRIARRAA